MPSWEPQHVLKCPLGWQNTLNCPLSWLKHDKLHSSMVKTRAKLPSWEPKRALKCPLQWRECAVCALFFSFRLCPSKSLCMPLFWTVVLHQNFYSLLTWRGRRIHSLTASPPWRFGKNACHVPPIWFIAKHAKSLSVSPWHHTIFLASCQWERDKIQH